MVHKSSLNVQGTGGGGTVTNVSVVTSYGFSGNVANPTTTPAITILYSGYIHTQNTPSVVWSVSHNLNRYVSVTVVDSAKNPIYADIVYNDLNNCTITLSAATSGFVYCN